MSWGWGWLRAAAPGEAGRVQDPLYRFARRLKSVDEAPPAMAAALTAAAPPGAAIRSLIFGPGNDGIGAERATLFALLDDRWIVVAGLGSPRVDQAAFADTLSAELTTVLLFGRLKLDYAAADGTRSSVVEFNTVMERVYRDALRRVLDGAEGLNAPAAVADERLDGLLKVAPLKFRNAARDCRPPAQRVRAARHWPAAMTSGRRWLRRERAPQGMLMLTERELIWIAEERTPWWMQVFRSPRYGYVATFCPLTRIATWRVAANDEVATLELALRGGATVKAELPGAAGQELAEMMTARLVA